MQMIHRLTSVNSDVGDNTITIVQIQFLGQISNDQAQMTGQSLIVH